MNTETICDSLVCGNCNYYMTNYIYLCHSGHSICEKCRRADICSICKSDISPIRNVALETISKTVHFPCENRPHGCKYNLPADQLLDHSVVCNYRLYECQLNKTCPWEGKREDLEKHCLKCHETLVVIGHEMNSYWNDNKANSSITLMMAFDNSFYVHKKVKDGIMYWSVQYIGRSEDVILFCFNLTITSDQYNERHLSLNDICHDDSKDMDDIIETGLCVAVPINVLETHTNTQGVIGYKITILQA